MQMAIKNNNDKYGGAPMTMLILEYERMVVYHVEMTVITCGVNCVVTVPDVTRLTGAGQTPRTR